MLLVAVTAEVLNVSPAPEPTGEAYRGAVSMLLPYLLSWRTRLSALEQEVSECQCPICSSK